ncbi:putative Methylosome subunit pICln [Zostera marina]|uniref:Putative Methylosome subunit pICln n=1 Tax=Zostera marina TaxID=29655 RepID=A0A0K9Q4E9_ZOSMR|nr:putative Methylosome subunit pICln [Zostera marina]
MASGLRLFRDRVGNQLTADPVLDASGGEKLMHVEPSVVISLGNRLVEAAGTLYVTTKQVVWLSEADVNMGYALDFLSISLHAVSTDPKTFAFPCIYIQIDSDCADESSDDSECEDIQNMEHTDFLKKITELRLGPSNPNNLNTLFNVLCDCAELNPDVVPEQDENNEWNFGGNQMSFDDSEWMMSENASLPIGLSDEQQILSRTLQELNMNDQRFEDAEESENMADKS